jgi:hypothetical protein
MRSSLLDRVSGGLFRFGEEVGFAHDSALEEDGFELLVPVVKRRLLGKWNQGYAAPALIFSAG